MIRTERLTIKKYELSMAKQVSELSKDIDNRTFLPDEVFETEEDAKKILEYLINGYDNGGPYVYPIFLDEELIGHVEIINLGTYYEIGYHLGSKYTGHGYAKEALLGLLDYVKNTMGIDKVYGICLKDNVKSIKVLEKSGFTLEFDGIDSYQGEPKEIVKYVKVL